MDAVQLTLTRPERDALLAGLRLLQHFIEGRALLHDPEAAFYIHEIANDSGHALTVDQLDTLADLLNP